MTFDEKLPDLFFDEELRIDFSLTEHGEAAEILKKKGFGVVLAMNIEQAPEVFAKIFNTYTSHNIKVIGWPLVGDDKGYWPNKENFDYFSQKLIKYLKELKQQGIILDWLCLDVEPTLFSQKQIMEVHFGFVNYFIRAVRRALTLKEFSSFYQKIGSLLDSLHSQGCKVILVTPLLVTDDLVFKGSVWQKANHSAVISPETQKLLPFDAILFMLFPSEYVDYAHLLFGKKIAQNLFFKTLESYVVDTYYWAKERNFEGQIFFQTGLLGETGKRGREPIFEKPEDFYPYAIQLNALAQKFGFGRAYYSLEGVTKNGQLKEWLEAVQSKNETLEMVTHSSKFTKLVRKMIYNLACIALRVTGK
ncbi:MAG: hypothetical protein ACOZBZ_01445 [Patescibacteria group bacterium]